MRTFLNFVHKTLVEKRQCPLFAKPNRKVNKEQRQNSIGGRLQAGLTTSHVTPQSAVSLNSNDARKQRTKEQKLSRTGLDSCSVPSVVMMKMMMMMMNDHARTVSSHDGEADPNVPPPLSSSFALFAIVLPSIPRGGCLVHGHLVPADGASPVHTEPPFDAAAVEPVPAWHLSPFLELLHAYRALLLLLLLFSLLLSPSLARPLDHVPHGPHGLSRRRRPAAALAGPQRAEQRLPAGRWRRRGVHDHRVLCQRVDQDDPVPGSWVVAAFLILVFLEPRRSFGRRRFCVRRSHASCQGVDGEG